ncbi:MAG: DUF5131 family protein [bacterium]
MLSKTKIDWADYTINPIKGICKHNCSYCYARRFYKRFKWNPEIRYDLNAFKGIEKIKAGSIIFVGSTHDIFGNWIDDFVIKDIFTICDNHKNQWFVFLTKNPKRYCDFFIPKNCIIGMSITGENIKKHKQDWASMKGIDALKLVSIEPLLKSINFIDLNEIFTGTSKPDWIIVGGLTPKPVHKSEWVFEIRQYCKINEISLFEKRNLIYKNCEIVLTQGYFKEVNYFK